MFQAKVPTAKVPLFGMLAFGGCIVLFTNIPVHEKC